MSAGPARVAFPVLAILVLAALLGWYFLGRGQLSSPGIDRPTAERAAPRGATPAPTLATPPSLDAQTQPVPALPRPDRADAPPAATGPRTAETQGAADRPSGPQAPEPRPPEARPAEAARPSFDVVRVEPSGDSVIAGRAGPGAAVDLLRNGEPFARAMADTSGLFAIVPPALPPGTHEIILQSIAPDGVRVRSGQSVTVVIAAGRERQPLVTVTAPDQPTVVLSRPDEPAPASTVASTPTAPGTDKSARRDANGAAAGRAPAAAAGGPRPPIRIAVVESEGEGRLFVSGQAAPGATVRLYLNDAFVAPGGTGPDGRLSFTIERGIRPGDYRVRLDDVDPVTGSVKSRAEVGFNVPPAVASSSSPVIASNAAPTGPTTRPAAPAADPRAIPERRDAAPPPGTPERSAVAERPGPGQNSATAPATPAQRSSTPQGTAGAAGPQTSPPPAVRVAPAGPNPAASRAPADTQSGPAASVPPRLDTPGPATSSPRVASAAVGTGASPPAGSAQSTSSTDPGQIIVPEVNTAIVARGDNLWRISKRVYGRGLRYTVIFDANTPQIRNPDLIYPGQVFVLPAGPQADKR